MRVYVLAVLLCLCSLRCLAVDDNDQEVKVVGDKNYTNNAALVYDGIDISNYQKDINWDATAKDKHIKYVYIKATEGASHKQHRYRRNIEHARQRGIKVGSYHFMTTTAPIQKQFENFISVVRPEEQDLIPLLDVEKRNGWSIKQLQDSVMKFAKLLENYYGCKPMIYASSNYFNNYLGAQFKHYPLFIARYSKSEPQLSYGAKWILWQFSDCGRIEGIDALVDLSRFNKGCGVKDIAYHHKGSHQPSKPRRNNGDVPRPRPREKKEQPAVPPPQQRGNAGTQPTRTEKSEAQKRGEENERRRQKQEEERRKKEEEKRRKEEEKRRKEEEKRRKEEEKKRQEQEKKRQEQEKKRQEQEKKRQEQEKKRQEQEKQRQAAEMKQQAQERRHQEELARQRQLEEDKRLAEQQRQQQERDRQRSQAQAQERMRREKQRQQQELAQEQEERDRQRKDELEQARQERIEKQRHQQQAAGNQSKPASGKQQQVASTQPPASRHQAPARPQAPRPRKPGGNQSSADNDEVHYNSQWRSHAKKKDNDDDD